MYIIKQIKSWEWLNMTIIKLLKVLTYYFNIFSVFILIIF